jgi:hypothetical protein
VRESQAGGSTVAFDDRIIAAARGKTRPLFGDQRFRGVMSLGWSEPREMKPAEVETLSTIGGVVAPVGRSWSGNGLLIQKKITEA